MQKSLRLPGIGICAGLAVLFGIIIHRHSPVTPTVPLAAKATRTPSSTTADAYGRLPLSFERNQGQVDKHVTFLSHGPGYSLFLTANQAVLSLNTSWPVDRGSWIVDDHRGHFTNHEPRTTNHEFVARGQVSEHLTNHEPRSTNHDAVLRMRLLGANLHPQVSGVGELPGSVNYFIGNDPKKWRSHVPTYSRVSYKQVYPGIDMVYYGNRQQLEYDWVVAPGADVHQIQLEIKGAEKATLTAQGDLQLHMRDGDVIQHAPITYQQIDGVRKPVSSHLALPASSSGGERRIGFEVGAYDHSRPLIIDPVLVYATYLGGSGGTEASCIAVDSFGNAYIAGFAYGDDLPLEVPYQSTNHNPSGDNTVFVSALNSSGTALLYSTYLGGSGGDQACGIAVDSAGNAYITGDTGSTDFPTVNAFQSTSHVGSTSTGTAFVTKLNSTGSALVYSTYLGGSGGDDGDAIAVDSSNNAYVTGGTASTDFPTKNPYQASNRSPVYGNGFVTKFNASGSALIYSTYLGGTGTVNSIEGDGCKGIAVDSSGNAYVTGYTHSSNFPITAKVFQSTNHSGLWGNAFVTKINPTGSALIYSTYLGSYGKGIAVDSGGNAYVTGANSNEPLVNPIQQAGNSFVLEMNSVGSALLYSTGVACNAAAIAVDSYGAAYVTGTAPNNFPVQSPLQAVNPNGLSNAFIARIGNYNRQTVDLTVGVENYTRLLWINTNFTVQVWTVNSSGQTLNISNFGPVAGYTVKSIASGPDGMTRILWNNTAGEAGISLLKATNAYVTENYYTIPATNWSVVDIAVGADNNTRLLWTRSDGTVSVRSAANAGNYFNLVNFGPYTGWIASRIAAGSDGLTRLLWTKNDGTVALWILNANNTLKSSFNLGPFAGWRGIDLAVGVDNKTRLLWTKSDGTAAVWTVDNSGVATNITDFGPYTGWNATKIAAGPDGLTRLLWFKGDGTQAFWLLNANNSFNNGFNYGPY